MKTKQRKTCKFAHDWDEIEYLRDKLLYWLYRREDSQKARPYAERLERLLTKADPDHEAILGEECWSLIHETRKEFPKAIKSRRNEIDLIRRLHDICRNQPYEKSALSGYEYPDWRDRLDLLASLYHDSGDLGAAVRTLQESKEFCKRHGIPFRSQRALNEYLRQQDGILAGK
jgi:hypothetical protein